MGTRVMSKDEQMVNANPIRKSYYDILRINEELAMERTRPKDITEGILGDMVYGIRILSYAQASLAFGFFGDEDFRKIYGLEKDDLWPALDSEVQAAGQSLNNCLQVIALLRLRIQTLFRICESHDWWDKTWNIPMVTPIDQTKVDRQPPKVTAFRMRLPP